MVQRAPVEKGQSEDAVLLQSQGCFLPHRSPHWQIGELSLSAQRFAFGQGGRPRFELPLARITAVAVERRKFILLRKEVIRLSYALADDERNRQAWLITPDLARWLEKLMTITNTREGTGRPAGECGRSSGSSSALPRPMSTPARDGEAVRVREDQVRELAAAVGPPAARVLWHLWERRHAGIEELADLVDAPTHMDVLTLLREGINEPARRLLGGPVLVFKERALDRSSGRSVCFNWWLERAEEASEAAADAPDSAQPLVEIHDEGEALLVVAMVPGGQAETFRAKVRGRSLLLAAETVYGPCALTVSLPCRVLAKPAKVVSRNTVLSLWLAKRSRR
jgi:HSP20 family molecular chaperone IbpA